MDSSLITPSNIMFVMGILGIIFTVYNYFRNPQIMEERKASLLAQQVQWAKESTDKRFEEVTKMMNATMTLAQNHIHTVDTKVENLNATVSGMGIAIARLSTIIEERIPKKIT